MTNRSISIIIIYSVTGHVGLDVIFLLSSANQWLTAVRRKWAEFFCYVSSLYGLTLSRVLCCRLRTGHADCSVETCLSRMTEEEVPCNEHNRSHCLMLGCVVRRVRVGVRSWRNVTWGGLADNEWETLRFHRGAFDGPSSVSSRLNLFDKIISVFAQTQRIFNTADSCFSS